MTGCILAEEGPPALAFLGEVFRGFLGLFLITVCSLMFSFSINRAAPDPHPFGVC